MKKSYRKEIEKLDLFLADTEGESTEMVAEELTALGTDTKTYLADLNVIVRKGYQAALKEIAAAQRAEITQNRKSRFAGLAKTKEQMVGLIARIQNGEFGLNLQQRARCRNQDQSKVSEEDLRSWLEDIDASESL